MKVCVCVCVCVCVQAARAHWDILDVLDAVVEGDGGLLMRGRHEERHRLLALAQSCYISEWTQEPQPTRIGVCVNGGMSVHGNRGMSVCGIGRMYV